MCSMMAVLMLGLFAGLANPQIQCVHDLQAESVCKQLASDLSGLRGYEIVDIGSVVAKLEGNQLEVESIGHRHEARICRSAFPTIGSQVVVMYSNGSHAWMATRVESAKPKLFAPSVKLTFNEDKVDAEERASNGELSYLVLLPCREVIRLDAGQVIEKLVVTLVVGDIGSIVNYGAPCQVEVELIGLTGDPTFSISFGDSSIAALNGIVLSDHIVFDLPYKGSLPISISWIDEGHAELLLKVNYLGETVKTIKLTFETAIVESITYEKKTATIHLGSDYATKSDRIVEFEYQLPMAPDDIEKAALRITFTSIGDRYSRFYIVSDEPVPQVFWSPWPKHYLARGIVRLMRSVTIDVTDIVKSKPQGAFYAGISTFMGKWRIDGELKITYWAQSS